MFQNDLIKIADMRAPIKLCLPCCPSAWAMTGSTSGLWGKMSNYKILWFFFRFTVRQRTTASLNLSTTLAGVYWGSEERNHRSQCSATPSHGLQWPSSNQLQRGTWILWCLFWTIWWWFSQGQVLTMPSYILLWLPNRPSKWVNRQPSPMPSLSIWDMSPRTRGWWTANKLLS